MYRELTKLLTTVLSFFVSFFFTVQSLANVSVIAQASFADCSPAVNGLCVWKGNVWWNCINWCMMTNVLLS